MRLASACTKSMFSCFAQALSRPGNKQHEKTKNSSGSAGVVVAESGGLQTSAALASAIMQEGIDMMGKVFLLRLSIPSILFPMVQCFNLEGCNASIFFVF